MSALTSLGSPGPLVGVALGGIFLVLVLWFGWRKPTWLFLLALASLAIRPQLLWGGPDISYEWGLHQSLIAFALAMNALRYGVRRSPNWPILALVATFGLSLAFGNLHPKLTLPFMLMSLAILALPFAFTQVVLESGSRRAYAVVIMLTPLLSVALGVVLEKLSVGAVWSQDPGEVWRLKGATGNAAVFAMLAFAGFVVALHEITRPRRPYACPLAVINLILVILSGTRMAILASAIFVVAYVAVSSALRAMIRTHVRKALLGAGILAAGLLLYLPMLWKRLFANDGGFSSGRDRIWLFYLEEFSLSPLFGRGIGADFVAGADTLGLPLPTPHNEYLHLLVIGGIMGFVLYAAAIGLWSRHLWRLSSPNDRGFLLALAPALLVYAVTDNILLYTSALGLYAYLGTLLAAPSPYALPPGEAEAWRPAAASLAGR